MPIGYAVHNDIKLFVHFYSGRVTARDLSDLVSGLAGQVSGSGTYRGLAIFDQDVDLSELDVSVLNSIRNESKAAYQKLGIQRGNSAAIVDGAQEARLIMPLWNALCDADPDFDHRFGLFQDVEAALEFLAIPPESAPQILAIMSNPSN